MGLLWIGTVAADGEVANQLFSDVPALSDSSIAAALSEQERQDRQDPTIVKSRYVIVNFEKLGGKHLPQGAETIVLNLFADLSLTAAKKRTERRSPTQYTWFGHIRGAKYSQVILVVNDGSMAGNIGVDGKLYQVRAVGQGVHAIYEIDQSAFPPEAPPVPVNAGPAEVQEDAASNPRMEESDGETVIDVMVVYSDDVADAVADIDSLIQLAIDETNESYAADGEVVNQLFSDVPALTNASIAAALSEQDQQNRQDPTIVKSRHVIVNFEKLAGQHLPQGAETVVLNLFADLSLTAVKKRTERRSPTQYTWFGHIQGAKYSQVILVVDDGSMAGNIRLDGKLYQARAVGQGVHAIYEIDQSAFPPEAPPVPVDSGPAEVQEDAGSNPLMEESDGETVIDVMVVYSDDVADAVADIDSLIQLAIDETNESYSNSNVNQRLRLVHRAEVDYVETGDSSTDLNRLRDSSDGFIDEIHTLRDTYGADCVSFWVESMGACGRGLPYGSG